MFSKNTDCIYYSRLNFKTNLFVAIPAFRTYPANQHFPDNDLAKASVTTMTCWFLLRLLGECSIYLQYECLCTSKCSPTNTCKQQ